MYSLKKALCVACKQKYCNTKVGVGMTRNLGNFIKSVFGTVYNWSRIGQTAHINFKSIAPFSSNKNIGQWISG